MYSFSPEFAGFQHAQIVKLPYLDALIAACFVRIPQRESKQRLALTSRLIDLLSIQRAWNRHWATKDQVEVTILRAIKLLRTERVSNINSAFFELLRDAPILNSDNAPALVSSNKRWIRYFLGRLAYELEIKNGKKPNKNLIDGKGPPPQRSNTSSHGGFKTMATASILIDRKSKLGGSDLAHSRF
jgi:hypothetical protein